MKFTHTKTGRPDKHGVDIFESEEVFFNEPDLGTIPLRFEHGEERFYAVGKTTAGRILTVIFTIRNHRIRVISARDASRKERGEQNEKSKKNS